MTALNSDKGLTELLLLRAEQTLSTFLSVFQNLLNTKQLLHPSVLLLHHEVEVSSAAGSLLLRLNHRAGAK